MKKIKHKSKNPRGHCPAWLVGYVGEIPPAGYLSTWYNQEYGGPLHIRFPKVQSNTFIEASHVDWKAEVRLDSPPNEVAEWQTRIGWDHRGVAQVVPVSRIGVSRMDAVLFLARLGRGLTLLTSGTAFDLVSQLYWNPSDWTDRSLTRFSIKDHVYVHQEESLADGRQRFVTRGMGKFGLEELEIFRPRGLTDRLIIDRLLELAHVCLNQGKCPKVGEQFLVPSDFEAPAYVVKHRTVSLPSGQLNVREVCWD